MKRFRYPQFLIVSLIILLILGCKKKDGGQEIGDIRDKYVGNWKFTTYVHGYWIGPGNSNYDTIYFDGTIAYGIEDKYLQINWGPENSSNIFLDPGGNWRWLDPKSNPAGLAVFNSLNDFKFGFTSGDQMHKWNYSINGVR